MEKAPIRHRGFPAFQDLALGALAFGLHAAAAPIFSAADRWLCMVRIENGPAASFSGRRP